MENKCHSSRRATGVGSTKIKLPLGPRSLDIGLHIAQGAGICPRVPSLNHNLPLLPILSLSPSSESEKAWIKGKRKIRIKTGHFYAHENCCPGRIHSEPRRLELAAARRARPMPGV